MSAAGALREPGLRWYLIGQLQSVTGAWAQVVALSWVVVELDPRALGWVVALQFAPSLLLGPWCGALADRHDRRRLLIAAEAGLASVAIAYAAATATGAPRVPVVLALAAMWGLVNALDTPARQALVPMLVPAEHAAHAATLSGAVLLLGMTLGSAAGAAIVATTGAAVAFAVNAATFIADIVVLVRLPVGPSPRVAWAPGQIRAGARYVARTGVLREPLLAVAALGSLAFTVQVTVPILIAQSFGGRPQTLGAAFAAVTTGCLGGALTLAARRAPGTATLRPATAIMAVGLTVVTVAPTAPALLLGLATTGFAWAGILGSVVTMLQAAEPAMMGRVMALFAVTLLGGTAVGGPLAGTLATTAHPRAPFLLGALTATTVAAALTERRHGRPGRIT